MACARTVHASGEFPGAADALAIRIHTRHLSRPRPQEIGAKVTRLYEQNFDAGGSDFLCQRFGNAFQGEFGRGISTETRERQRPESAL